MNPPSICIPLDAVDTPSVILMEREGRGGGERGEGEGEGRGEKGEGRGGGAGSREK